MYKLKLNERAAVYGFGKDFQWPSYIRFHKLVSLVVDGEVYKIYGVYRGQMCSMYIHKGKITHLYDERNTSKTIEYSEAKRIWKLKQI